MPPPTLRPAPSFTSLRSHFRRSLLLGRRVLLDESGRLLAAVCGARCADADRALPFSGARCAEPRQAWSCCAANTTCVWAYVGLSLVFPLHRAAPLFHCIGEPPASAIIFDIISLPLLPSGTGRNVLLSCRSAALGDFSQLDLVAPQSHSSALVAVKAPLPRFASSPFKTSIFCVCGPRCALSNCIEHVVLGRFFRTHTPTPLRSTCTGAASPSSDAASELSPPSAAASESPRRAPLSAADAHSWVWIQTN